MSKITVKIIVFIMAILGWGFLALQFWFNEDVELWRRIFASLFSGAVIVGIFWCGKKLFGDSW